MGRAALAAAIILVAGVGPSHAVAPGASKKDTGSQAAQTAGAEVWPMPLDRFLAGQYLERSDVVLTRRNGDAVSYLIRWATSSIFSHAALIFTGPQFESGYSNTFVIEAGTKGVDLTNLRDFVTDTNAFVAIKRLRRDWFDQPKQSRVRGVLLDKIKATYNYWAVGRIARNIWFGVQQKMQGKEKTIETYRKREWTPPQEFICSGLVQLGFIEATMEYIERGQLPPSALVDVVFHKEALSRLPAPDQWKNFDPAQAKATALQFRDVVVSDLESVTPEDIATSDKLEWRYLIRGTEVHRVSSYDDVKRIIQ